MSLFLLFPLYKELEGFRGGIGVDLGLQGQIQGVNWDKNSFKIRAGNA